MTAVARCRGWCPSVRRATEVVVGVGLASFVVAPAHAAPGNLLVAESERGTVLEFSAGGDLSTARRFATGLTEPLGLCVGPGGDIYVAESGSGEITVITAGGDFTDAIPFAFGPFTPVDLWCDESTVLVSVPLPPVPAIANITQGGNIVQNIDLHATGLPGPLGMTRDDVGTLYSANNDVFDVTTAGGFAEATPFTTGRNMATLTWTGDALWGGGLAAPEVYDLTAGGDISAALPVVTLPAVGNANIDGLLTTVAGTVYAVTGDEIYEITAGGDLSGAQPFATGLGTGQRGFTGMLEHVCSADTDCTDADLCNGQERCVDNRCVEPEQPLSCDDGDACTSETCDAVQGCAYEPVPSCCDEDLDCGLDELCDVEAMTCVPVGQIPMTDGEDDTAADTDDTGSMTEGSSGSGGGETDPGGDADGEGTGCGCRSQPGAPAALPWMLVALVAGRRRRGA